MIHPLWLRVSHWINVVVCLIMITSGWRIYNASPLFDFYFPKEWVFGGWLGGALQWHFAGMWLFTLNGLFYILMNIFTGRLKRRFWPLSGMKLINDIKDTFCFKLKHADMKNYNMLQKIAYLFISINSLLLILSGLVIWKSVQFSFLNKMLGGYDNARYIHFYSMSAMVVFIIIHLIMVMLVPKTLLSITRGH